MSNRQKGAIALLLLLVLPVFFTFFAWCIDHTTTKLATHAQQTQGRQLGRSLLAQYDTSVQEYGLFGASVDSVESTWQTLESFQEKKALWRNMKPMTAKAHGLYPLADHRVFSRQIFEAMKLGVFAQTAIEASDRWLAIKKPLQEATAMAQNATEIQKWVHKREQLLRQLWQSVQSWVKTIWGAGVRRDGSAQIAQWIDQLQEANKINDQIHVLFPQGTAPIVLPMTYFNQYQLDLVRWVAMETQQQANPSPEGVQFRREVQVWHDQQQQVEQTRAQWFSGQQQQTEATAHTKPSLGVEAINQICRRIDPTAYAQLLQWEQTYRAYNEHSVQEGSGATLDRSDSMAFTRLALRMIDRISDLFTQIGEEILLNEYVLGHTSYRTVHVQQPPVKPFKEVASHVLADQEGEYILYGLPNCALNLLTAQTELLVFRTGLRMIEAIVKKTVPTDAVSPWLWLGRVIVQSLHLAQQDVERLLRGEVVPTPLLDAIQLNYKDHLRVFLMLHGRNEAVLSRLQSVISLNTGVRLTEQYSALELTVQHTMATWIRGTRTMQAKVVVRYD